MVAEINWETEQVLYETLRMGLENGTMTREAYEAILEEVKKHSGGDDHLLAPFRQLVSQYHPTWIKNFYTSHEPQENSIWQTSSLHLNLLGQNHVTLDGILLNLRPRYVEILCVLALHPQGLTGEELGLAVWGEGFNADSVKKELSRLRHIVPLESRPYRIGVPVTADFLSVLSMLREGNLARAVEDYTGSLLSRSDAPQILETRFLIEQSLRQFVLNSKNPELILKLAKYLQYDLEVLEEAQRLLPITDGRQNLISTQITLVKSYWQGELSRPA